MIGLSLPALRGTQGGRVFYQCMVKNSTLNTFFTVNMEPAADRSQRTLDPKHAREIAEYVVDNAEGYLLGAITYAMDTEGAFTPSDLDPSIGVLTIPMSANMRSLDGQHRRQGLKEAIDEDPSIAEDYTSVLIYVESELLERKQMFSDMNATPKVVAKALNVSYDNRDPYARAAVRLAEEHPMLTGHVEMESARVKAASTDYFSLAGVYEAIKRLDLGLTVPRGRLPKKDVDDLVDLGTNFFDLLQEARAEFTKAAGMTVGEMKAYREQTILFSTTTLRALAGAVYEAAQEKQISDLTEFADSLSKIDFSPDAAIFVNAGFVSPGKTTPNARNQEVHAATIAIKEELTR
ncbi:DNA sulfur modification protein DndB [Cellulosimicrobium cellulans]|uniref:DNA sulfur modification protein DndB n=1 Tax=Cellulosimicrobium cellulans TaxID=1710 RepID=UPI001966BD20|nr:DNA sulfur modification protein DndB [Cellulosimicrobium cellulans]MBN0041850.1 DNA sulfur modification protein DndB [Cellulosimicrobium cellulans]